MRLDYHSNAGGPMSARCRRFIGLAMVLLAGLPLFGADTQRKTIQFLSVWPADQDNGRLIMDLRPGPPSMSL